MPTDVIMPQMGESIFEGTLTKWLKKPGDKVQRDEPLFEISTDKVDAEIPAPASGVLKEQKVAEGTTVQVNTVVGVIDEAGAAAGASAPAPAKAAPAASAPAKTGGGAPSAGPTEPVETRKGDGARGAASPTAPREGEEETEIPTMLRDRKDVETSAKPLEAAAQHKGAANVIEYPERFDRTAEGDRIRSSPLVRKIAKENNINLAEVAGTGLGGRISREDIEKYISAGGAQRAAQRPATAATAAAYQPAPQPAAAAQPMTAMQPVAIPIPGEVVPMTQMRKKIAEHMVLSKRTSAHVHSIFQIDMTRIVKLRERMKREFEQRTGSKLTFTPFFARAVVNAIAKWPIVNASVEGENIHYHRNVNLGIAVALDWGLIVPVVKNAEERNFLGLQRAISDLGERARGKKLKPDEVQGGTFTITNPGIFGPLFGLPIINQPQVAILGIGGIVKTPVVVTDEDGTDSIAIRSIMHVSLGYDHRVIDGAVADQFLMELKKFIEGWNEALF